MAMAIIYMKVGRRDRRELFRSNTLTCAYHELQSHHEHTPSTVLS